MLDHRDDGPDRVEAFKTEFKAAIALTNDLWGDVAFQRWDGQRWRQQALAGLFDAQMIGPLLLTARAKENGRKASASGRADERSVHEIRI